MDMSGIARTRPRGAAPQDWVDYLKAQHPRDTAKHVAVRISGSARTVEKWLQRETRPDFDAVFALIHAYGPELLAVLLPVSAAWCNRLAREARRERIRAAQAALEAELAALDLSECGGG